MTKFSFLGKEFQTQRIIGHLNPENQDRVMVLVGGMHGNEPTGVIALEHVFQQLEKNKVPVNGRLIGLCGNLAATEKGVRFHSADLNRLWLTRNIERMKNTRSIEQLESPEEKEQFELFNILQPIFESDMPVTIIDLHTTSGPSIPFIVLNDQIANRNFGLQFPVPTVIGIEEYLEGPLLSYANEFGHVALAYEAGKHDDWTSYENHVSFLFLALVNAGMVAADDIPDLEKHRLRLQNQCKVNRGIFEVIHREKVYPEDQFNMNPGYQNFWPLQKHEQLAQNSSGVVKSRFRGQIFMPLYQSEGTDGFFIVRPVPKWALSLSTFLRKRNFEWLLTLLPGISRSQQQPETLVVNKSIARFLAKELFHLLGYRRKKEVGNEMIFSRREIS